MKPLKKPTKAKNCQHQRRLDRVCEEIRKALHLDRWRYDYTIDDKVEDANASCKAPKSLGNRRVWVTIHAPFWTHSGDEQLHILIHEHVHAVLSPYDQAAHNIASELHYADKPWADFIFGSGVAETVTDHLEAVLYDLLKDRFADL